MLSRFLLFSFLSLLPAMLPSARAQNAPSVGAIVGQVLDAETGEPLLAATVEIADSERGAMVRPGDAGFRIEHVPPGAYRVRAYFIKYCSEEMNVRVEAGVETPVVFRLEKAKVYPESSLPRLENLPNARVFFRGHPISTSDIVQTDSAITILGEEVASWKERDEEERLKIEADAKDRLLFFLGRSTEKRERAIAAIYRKYPSVVDSVGFQEPGGSLQIWERKLRPEGYLLHLRCCLDSPLDPEPIEYETFGQMVHTVLESGGMVLINSDFMMSLVPRDQLRLVLTFLGQFTHGDEVRPGDLEANDVEQLVYFQPDFKGQKN